MFYKLKISVIIILAIYAQLNAHNEFFSAFGGQLITITLPDPNNQMLKWSNTNQIPIFLYWVTSTLENLN